MASVVRYRIALAALVLATFAGHVLYLACNSPVDLAEDECYYWDWSRQLDIAYYSKGPVTPLLMRASCAMLGDTMLAVRLPALFMRAGLTICIFWLTWRLFGSERLALGAALLTYLAPMMLAAGLVMTTDPPFLFLWSLATCLAAAAIFGGRRWAWVAAGMAVGLGFLTKFSMPLWLIGLALFLLCDAHAGPMLRTRWPWVMVLVALPFTFPVLLWNSRHGWVTFLHVGEDIGVRGEAPFAWGNLLEFWTGQMEVIGPLLFTLVMAAVVWGLWCGPAACTGEESRQDACTTNGRRAVRFLLCMSLPVFALVFLDSFRHHPAENWPASSYICLLPLTAYFLAGTMSDRRQWRWWRLLFYPAVVLGIGINLLAHNTELLYPAIARFNGRFPDHAIKVRKIDPTHRLHAWAEVGKAVGPHYRAAGPDAMLLAADYQTAAELAFYVPGQPKTYCIGSYISKPAYREPFSQYDIWLDRRLDRDQLPHTGLGGRSALYVGEMNEEIGSALRMAFAAPPQFVERVRICRAGLLLREVEVWRCERFRGLPWPGWEGRYNK